jgi:hypothetical protein
MLTNVFDGYNVTIFAYGQTVCQYSTILFPYELIFMIRVQEKLLP